MELLKMWRAGRLWFTLIIFCAMAAKVFGDCPLTQQCRCADVTAYEIKHVTCRDLGHVSHLPELLPDYRIIRFFEIDKDTCNVTALRAGTFDQLKMGSLKATGISLQTIEDGALQRLNVEYLEELFLDHNELSSLTRGTLAKLSSLVQLRLNNNRLMALQENVFKDLVNLQYLYLQNNAIDAINVASFSGLERLTHLSLMGNKLTSLADGIFNVMPKLTLLNIRENSLQELPDNVFRALSALERLDLSVNNLTTLSRDMFSGKTNLTYLDLAHNRISELPQTLFSDLHNVKYLDLSYNHLTSFHEQLFGRTKKLQQLYMDHNQLREIPAVVFENLENLKVLHLQNNQITRFSHNNLVGLSFLEEFVMHSNRLGALPLGLLDPFGALLYLDLSYNALSKFEDDRPFISLKDLQYLNLSYNSLLAIPGDLLERQTKLRTLRLNNNRIQRIEENSFANNVQLTELDLSSNWIFELDSPLFSNNSRLRTLKLSKNPLSVVGASAFKGLTSLQLLFMNNTCLTHISEGVYNPLGSSLKELYLQNNNLSTIETNTFRALANLETLNLAQNNFKSVQPDIFKTLSSLLYLNLSAAGLRDADTHILMGLSQLRVLDLSWNRFQRLSYDLFEELNERGRVDLYLAMNRLACDCDLVWLRDFGGLADSGATVCNDSGPSASLAVCYPIPPACDSNNRPTLNICSNPMRLVDWAAEPPIASDVDPNVCDLGRYTTTTTARPTTLPQPQKVELQGSSTTHNSVTLSWDTKEQHHHSFQITYREFSTPSTYSIVVNASTHSLTIKDLTPNKNYVICIRTLLNHTNGMEDCIEIEVKDQAPKLPPEPASKGVQTPLLLIIAVVGGVTLVVIILVSVFFGLRHHRMRGEETDQDSESFRGSSTSLRKKAAMWVNSFQFDGQLNEQVAEQSTLTWNMADSDVSGTLRHWKKNPKLAHIA